MQETGKAKLALITGASQGIGRALALEFAQGGYDVILVARDSAKLEALAAQCAQAFGRRAYSLTQDLSSPDAARQIIRWLEASSLEIDTLVNNAGFGVHGAFVETSSEREAAMIQTQLITVLELTKHAVKGMLRRGGGEILNVASVYAYVPVPHQAVYSACKSFLLSFSQSLAEELSGRSITVTVLCPGATRTAFRRSAQIQEKSPESGMSAEAVAALGYRALKRGQRVVVTGWVNRIFVAIIRHFPGSLAARVMRQISRHRGLATPP